MLDKNIKMTQILSKIAMNIQHQRIELKSFKIDATSEVLYYNCLLYTSPSPRD